MHVHVQVLGADTSAISTLRCLKLYLERLGSDFQNAAELHRVAGQCIVQVYICHGHMLLAACFRVSHTGRVCMGSQYAGSW